MASRRYEIDDETPQKWSILIDIHYAYKKLIFRVAQGLAGGMIRDPDLETLGMRFRQKNIMHTHLQG